MAKSFRACVPMHERIIAYNKFMGVTKSVRLLIVGGGVAGVRVAKDLLNRHISGLDISIVSPSAELEYHAGLYRTFSADTNRKVRIPYVSVFPKGSVSVIHDTIEEIDFQDRRAKGKKDVYEYDYIVLALGSEPNYYDIAGLRELGFAFKSYDDAVRLKKHLHHVFSTCRAVEEDRICTTHFVIVGGGATGVEVAGELVTHAKLLAKKYKIDPSLVTVDLISSTSRLVPYGNEEISHEVEKRLRFLGVNIYLHRKLMKEEVSEVFLRDMSMKTKTVVWVAGTVGHHLYRKWGLPTNKLGQVLTQDTLLVKGKSNVFAAGDGASVPDSGLASSAIRQGHHVAENIVRITKGSPLLFYYPTTYSTSIPIGHKWAASEIQGKVITGYPGWVFRKFLDMRFYLSVLPFPDALKIFLI